ncbi:hypothetical protein RM530_03830 [Algiphilus sp. W345]|uniref:Uncharacterized protein n=1 Tax=Banduia mediterranea TaxID=3075609 RepID=A0ABU2WG30_9GAMM|nr:hypothetical protein [Algiphilus sp. W345]MDT0496495.1 hypothetical protein [Algiphilus sp. W345]
MTYLITVTAHCDAVRNTAGDDVITITRKIEMPFVPRVGDRLGFGAGGDPMRVNEVFWHPEHGFDIWFDDVTHPNETKLMLVSGWWER